ncbi:MAG: hypothetical protein KJ838_00840 [Candidatus Omnitrophica bacterium]|nr:hypothetical protein [Candidatus Omnitrophota bacterium]
MGVKFKIIILILVLLLAASLFIVYNIQSSKAVLEREYAFTREKLTRENQDLAVRLDNSLKEQERLQQRMNVIRADLERISSENEKLKGNYELASREREVLLVRLDSYKQLEENWNFLQQEGVSLKAEVEVLRKGKLNLESKLEELRQENKELSQRIKAAKERPSFAKKEERAEPVYSKKEATQILGEREIQSVDLPPIVVSPSSVDAKISLPASLDGKILNVNSEYNFTVIDLGLDEGLKEGMVFEVLRQGQLLGKIEVIEIRQEIAACDIIQAVTPFETGDIVRY